MYRFMLTSMLAVSLTATSAASQGPGLKGKPGDNPAETRKHLLSLGWGDDYQTNAIVNDVAVDWGDGNSATIRVVPMTHANQVSWQAALAAGGNGYFVAKIYNLDDKPIPALGLGKLGTGYLWIGETRSGRGAAIYSIKNNGTVENQPKEVALGGYCQNNQHFDSRVELTDGHKCPGPFVPLARAASGMSMFSLASMRDSPPWIGGGLWVTCLGGCCEVVPK